MPPDEEAIKRMLKLMSRTPDEIIDTAWDQAHDDLHRVDLFETLAEPVETFFRTHADSNDVKTFYNKLKKDNNGIYPPVPPPADRPSFTAIDIGSHEGTLTTAMALQWTPPWFPFGSLVVYPTDVEEVVETKLMPTLKHHQKRELNEGQHPLFHPEKHVTKNVDRVIFRGDHVALHGLNAAQYNGAKGDILGPDPKAPGRYAIKLYDQFWGSTKSFKQQNIRYWGECSTFSTNRKHMRMEGTSAEFLSSVVDRVKVLDVTDTATWKNVDSSPQPCALVTCIFLMTEVGHRNPFIWKDVLKFADHALHPGGHLLHMDGKNHHFDIDENTWDFGDVEAMKRFVKDSKLKLELVECERMTNIGGQHWRVLWKKI